MIQKPNPAGVIAWVFVAMLLAMLLAGASAAQSAPPRASARPAEGLAHAEHLFAAGRFAEAAEYAQSLDTAEGLMLAVRSRLALAYTRRPARSDACEETVALAERASKSRPDDAESLRLWAIAVGNLARNGSSLAALAGGYPEQTRDLIERARALEPDSGWSHAMLGAWHAAIVDRLGATMADTLYGASAEAAHAAFARAIELDPANPILHAEFGHALLQLGDTVKARDELEAARRLPARDVMESVIQSHAVAALEALDDGDVASAKRILEPTC